MRERLRSRVILLKISSWSVYDVALMDLHGSVFLVCAETSATSLSVPCPGLTSSSRLCCSCGLFLYGIFGCGSILYIYTHTFKTLIK